MEPNTPLTLIRTAGPADAALLAQMGRKAFSEAYSDKNTPENMAAYLAASFSEEIQSRELAEKGSTFLIAEIDGAPAAFARLLDCQAPECVRATRPLELVRIYTLGPWIGRGIGGQMMRRCLEIAAERGYDAIWLSVWSVNDRAIAFYHRWGFEMAGTAAFTVGSEVQEDYIMVRRL